MVRDAAAAADDDLAADARGPVRAARTGLATGLDLSARGLPVRALEELHQALRLLDDQERSAGELAREGKYLRARLLLATALSRYELDADRAVSTRLLAAAQEAADAARAPEVLVAIHGQRGLVALRAGDLAEAAAELDLSVGLQQHAEPRDACIALLNRGTLLLDQGDLRQARADLRECAARATALDDGLLLFKATHNLGYVEYLAGDLPLALRMMEDAARTHLDAAGGSAETEPVLMLDRAQVLFEAGLLAEADKQLEKATALFAERHLEHDLAEVELSRARCALLSGKAVDALRWARSARTRFGRRGNLLWRCRAELVVCRALLVELTARRPGESRPVLALATRAEQLSRTAARLGGAWGADVESGARLVAAEALVLGGQVSRASTLLEGIGAIPVRQPLARGLQLAVVRARIAFAAGDRAAGRAEVSEGQRMLAAHRAQLGSVEAVTASAVHGIRLVDVDVAAAMEARDVAGVVDAVERGRATFAGPARVRPARDQVTAELTSQLRQVSERIRLLPTDASVQEAEELRASATRLRQEVRQQAWREGSGGTAPRPLSTGEIRGLVEGTARTVVDFVTHRGSLFAATIDARGERLRRVGELTEVDERGRRLHGDLRMMSNPLIPDVLRAAAARSFAAGAAWLDENLLADVVPGSVLHVVGPGQVITLPWGALPSRRGRPTAVSPHLSVPPAGAGRPGGIATSCVAVAGPGIRNASSEVAEIVDLWPGARALDGRAATSAATADALQSSDVVHLAVHGTHVVENPLFSSVRLVDGPLFAHELDGSRLRPSLVVLSSCDVGRATPTPGGQSLGFASVLLRLGVGVVVASVEPVTDELARSVMPRFHELVRSGRTPADALAVVGAETDEPVPFVCFTATLDPVG